MAQNAVLSAATRGLAAVRGRMCGKLRAAGDGAACLPNHRAGVQCVVQSAVSRHSVWPLPGPHEQRPFRGNVTCCRVVTAPFLPNVIAGFTMQHYM